MSAELAALFAAWWWKISLTGIGGWVGLMIQRHYKKKDDHQKALEARLKDTYTKDETLQQIDSKVSPLMEKQTQLHKDHEHLEAKFDKLMEKLETVLPEMKTILAVVQNDVTHIKQRLDNKDK